MLSPGAVIYELNPWETHAYQRHQYGAVAMDSFGDIYRYAKAGATGISAGKLQLGPAPLTNHENIAATAAVTANGLRKAVTLQLGATAATANLYAGGILAANDNSPEGETYRVDSHPAADSATTLEVTVTYPFKTSISTSSEFTLFHNAWNAVVEGTSSTSQPAGVPLVDIATVEFGWLKSKGIAAVLADETLDIGSLVTTGTSTAGAVEEMDDLTTEISDSFVGFAVVVGVDGEYRPVQLTID